MKRSIQRERAEFLAYVATISDAALASAIVAQTAKGRDDLAGIARREQQRRADAASKPGGR